MKELRTDRFKLKALFPDKAKKYAQKLHKKATELEFVRKGIPIDPDNIEIKEGERAAIRLITTPHLDRDGEILIPSGAILDDFRQSPSVLYAHDYKGLPIGSDQWVKHVKEGILAKTVYAKHQFAEDLFQCVKDGHLKSNSVGFIPVEAVNKEEDKKAFAEWQGVLEKDYGIEKEESGKAKAIYTKWIMLEHSDVPVASNAQSLNLAVSKGELTIQSDRLKKDLEIEVVKDIKIEVIKDKNDKKEKESKGEEKAEAGAEEEKERAEIISNPVTEGEIELLKHLPVFVHKADGTKLSKEKLGELVEMIKANILTKPKKETIFGRVIDDLVKDDSAAKPEYKERWNKSLSKIFDVERVESQPSTFEYALLEKFLECKTSKIFQNDHFIPSPLIGTQLSGIKAALSKYKLKDTRNFHYNGQESPPQYEMIQLSSTETDDFLVEGTAFYDADGTPLAIRFRPVWFGMSVSFSTNRKHMEWNKEVLMKSLDLADKNNKLKGEKFALSGEFLKHTDDDWDNLILPANDKDSIKKAGSQLKKKGEGCPGRGLLFVGAPGTGKTKTGRVLLNEVDSTFIWVSSKDFKQCDPLSALTLAFRMARKLAPSVLFLEDIDTWIKDYMTDLLKTELDGIQENKGVISILTSNFPEKLPDALLDRPGRFHHVVNFVLPGEDQRKEMLEKWAGDIGKELLDDIIEKTKGFSGAHLKELVDFAKIIGDEDDIEIEDALLKSLDKLIEQRELIEEIRENKVDVKAVWGKVRWAGGDIELVENVKYWLADEEAMAYAKEKKNTLGDQTVELRIMDIPELKEHLNGIQEQVTELKEGRVLSTKNRTLVKDTIEALAILKERLDALYAATEPISREEERTTTINVEKQVVIEKDNEKTDLNDRLEKALSGDKLKTMISEALNNAVDIAVLTKMGRVE